MFEDQNRQKDNSFMDVTDRSIDSNAIKNQLVMVPSSEMSNQNSASKG